MFTYNKHLVSVLMIAGSLFFNNAQANATCGPNAYGFCTGEVAMNRNYDVKILEIYSNGTARLLFFIDGSEGVFPVSDIIKVRHTLDGWHKGDMGLNRTYDVEVKQIYDNHTAKLRFLIDGSEGIFALSDITHLVSGLDGFQIGETAMNRNYDVTILQIYSNHTAKLRFNIDGSTGIFALSELVKRVDCINP